MSPQIPQLEVKNLSKTFHNNNDIEVEALHGINLHVNAGEFVSLLGPSGSGKSTLLEILAGNLSPDQGEIWLDGALTRAPSERRDQVAHMPQADLLLPWRTTLDNVALPLLLRGMQSAKARADVEKWLPLFGLEGFAGVYPSALSGGMRQRAALLRTYLLGRPILALDEPFGQLDALTRSDMQSWLLQVRATLGRTILLVTHSIDEALLLSDRLYLISQRPGQIIAEFPIPFPHPRKSDLQSTPEFQALKEAVLNRLRRE